MSQRNFDSSYLAKNLDDLFRHEVLYLAVTSSIELRVCGVDRRYYFIANLELRRNGASLR
jgi:hypothetical protein